MTRAREPSTPGIDLAGLRPAPAQQWGGVRMIPLIREHTRHDLRITRRQVDASVVKVGDGTAYCSFMPHAFVLDWNDDGQPLAALGGQLRGPGSGHFNGAARPRQTPILHRMAKREDRNALRFVPLHLAMEGFLALHFGGPDVAWTEYSREALTRGLSPRRERSVAGLWIDGLAEAPRRRDDQRDAAGGGFEGDDAERFVAAGQDDRGAPLHRGNQGVVVEGADEPHRPGHLVLARGLDHARGACVYDGGHAARLRVERVAFLHSHCMVPSY